MTPEEVKAKVREAYGKAQKNRNVWWQRNSGINDLFRDVKLYGREAGIDFSKTHLDKIVHEAVETAGCGVPALEMTIHGFGRAALDGMAHALREFTALDVEVHGTTVKLIWEETSPGLV